MRALRFLIPAALLLMPGVVHAQVVRGLVLEDSTARPVVGAAVDVLVRGSILMSARTDSTGSFIIWPRRSGRIVIRVTHPFYSALDSLELSMEAGETVAVEVRMGRTAVPLDPLIVTARTGSRLAGFQERMRRKDGFGQFVTRTDIEARPGARTTDLLRNLRGVEVTTIGRGGSDQPSALGTPDPSIPRVSIITMRTPTGACLPAIYIDGMAVRQFQDSGIDDFLKPEMLEGAEVYPHSAAAPPEFIDPELCGVVAFWTRAGLGGGGRWSWARFAAGTAAFLVMVAVTR